MTRSKIDDKLRIDCFEDSAGLFVDFEVGIISSLDAYLS